jgi:hypothetical protein
MVTVEYRSVVVVPPGGVLTGGVPPIKAKKLFINNNCNVSKLKK